MESRDEVLSYLLQELSAITGKPASSLSEQTRLIGRDAAVSSRELVELLLAVEEFADERLNVRFDWTSDSAMSDARSVFRTVGTLADHVAGLSVS